MNIDVPEGQDNNEELSNSRGEIKIKEENLFHVEIQRH